ncbi:MAG: protein rep [Methylococcales bacterium]|nr:protein rep [Methylococcales bacterium]
MLKQADLFAPLGIDANYSTILEHSFPPYAPVYKGLVVDSGVSTSNAKLSGFLETENNQVEGQYNPVIVRLERYAMQSAARKILRGSNTIRVNNCLRVPTRLPGNTHDLDAYLVKPAVRVFRRSDHSACTYGGLQTCGSVWCCAVCAAKISEGRKNELQQAIEQHNGAGGEVLMLTLTSPHYQHDKLSDVIERQKQALVYFNEGDNVTRFNKSIFYIGQVRALEVTHGRLRRVNNGWHPHYHILLFVRSGLNLSDLRKAFYDRWLRACKKADMSVLPDLKHGVRVDNGQYAAAYASKWGLENEMTKGHIKKSKNGETPFDLLRSYLTDNDKQAAALFREFAETFKRKRQLRWSDGLKQNFYIVERDDNQIAAETDGKSHLLGSIDLEDWQRILKADVRGQLLELARHGWEPVERFLLDLKTEYEVVK